MSTRAGDAVLAVVALSGVLAGLTLHGRPESLASPAAAVAGVALGLFVELGFAAAPERSRRLWTRPAVRVGAAFAVVIGGTALAVPAGPRVLAVLAWGLATYFLVLALVVAGAIPGPETWFDRD